ncbi:MAG TPA: hypothetical protein VIO64_03205 [Pseudobacteroides sp.]|uniref:hypothetical protein n=1 Tax=Pseudobacteroides sp. TaxID=1968840 RepID=UPI002F949B66
MIIIKALRQNFYKCLYILLAITAGLCLFLVSSAITLEKTIMNSEFHKKQVEKHNLYSYTQDQVIDSLGNINLNTSSETDSDQFSSILGALKKSITPDLIRLNLESLIEGIFQYLHGKSNFLPDIVLNTDANQSNINIGEMTDHNQKYSYALSKIKKVNLSLILQYFDRSDIADSLSIFKLYFYVINTIPLFLSLLAVLLLITAIAFSNNIIKLLKWLMLLFITWSASSLTFALFLIYKNSIIESSIYPVTSSIPLPNDITLSYVADCLKIIWEVFVVLGLVIGVVSLLFLIALKRKAANIIKDQTSCNKNRTIGSIKYGVCIFIFLLVISVLINKSYIVKKEFLENNFPVVLNKLKNYSTVTKIIPAKDTSISMLLVKLVDKKDKTPVSGLKMHLTGETAAGGVSSVDIISDENGDARHTLDKGKYRLSFDQDSFPDLYQLPSPVFFELKSAGTTIISIELDKAQDLNLNKWGIAEVEVFDKNNIPVPDIELYVVGNLMAPGNPDNLIAVTNSEGIAVLRLNEGSYKISFTTASFPQNYKTPPSIDIKVIANSIARYSIKLSEKKADSPMEQ